MTVSDRMGRIQPSPTLAMTQKAKEMKAAGMDVVDFSAGEPDFDTPAFIKEATVAAIQAGFTKYTPVAGIPALREAISRHIETVYHQRYAIDEITITCGAKEGLFAAFQTLLNTGDEVIIPAPYWVSYPDQVLLSDGKPVITPTLAGSRFKVTIDQVKAAITAKTKAIVINSPSNPTGAVYSADELAPIVDLCLSKKIWMISDDIYSDILFDGRTFANPVTVNPAAKETTIIINGLSKSHAMTGWRFGYAAAPKPIISNMNKWLSQVTSNVTSFVQKGALVAYSEDHGDIPKMVAIFDERRRLMVNAINAIPGVSCASPEGAFYCMVNVEALYGSTHDKGVIASSQDVSAYFLEAANVASVPGEAFGIPGFIRFSFATSTDNITKGTQRIASAVERLQRKGASR